MERRYSGFDSDILRVPAYCCKSLYLLVRWWPARCPRFVPADWRRWFHRSVCAATLYNAAARNRVLCLCKPVGRGEKCEEGRRCDSCESAADVRADCCRESCRPSRSRASNLCRCTAGRSPFCARGSGQNSSDESPGTSNTRRSKTLSRLQGLKRCGALDRALQGAGTMRDIRHRHGQAAQQR